jgi:hypothetical protein
MWKAIENLRAWRVWILTAAVVFGTTFGGGFAVLGDNVNDNRRDIKECENWRKAHGGTEAKQLTEIAEIRARQDAILKSATYTEKAIDAIGKKLGVELPEKTLAPNDGGE